MTPEELTPDQWNARWARADTPWDMRQPSPPLVHWLARGELPAGRRVFVPGCGSGHEVRLLAEAGFECVGADFAPDAAAVARQTIAGVSGAAIIQADVLAPPSVDPRFDWIFDQTFFCALHPDLRPRYAPALRRWLATGGELWAIVLRTDTFDRPPFDVTPEAYAELLRAAAFEIVETRALQSESHPARRGRETLVRARLARGTP